MTKKRILFVDDEPLVLQGLQRTLRSMREEWDMEFVGDGLTALAVMAEAPFDVVVSDMQMPGMNGAALLNEVMVRHPRTVRLILSGHADRELILKCVGSTHQYLSKPCEAQALKATIARAAALEGSFDNEKLMELVARVRLLPSLPSLYTEIIQCLQSAQVSTEEVGSIVARDIAMTAKLLKLVNSAFFGLGRPIANPAEAAAYLGTDIIKSLVLFVHVFSQFESARVKGFSPAALWDHSLQTSAAAKLIALTEGASRNLCEEAFVAGMLHDTGKLVLAANFPEQYGTVLAKISDSRSYGTAEREVFGCSHAEIGGYLLGLWGLPVPVVEAITLHHTPGASVQPVFSALTATHVANALLHQLEARPHPGAAGMDMDYLSALGLSERVPVWQAAWQEREPVSSALI
ncbi:MAG: response regulator [Verrucomicrobiota bacterium]|nr:HDOD domain-containing protein [Limisphaerales bacterium]